MPRTRKEEEAAYIIIELAAVLIATAVANSVRRNWRRGMFFNLKIVDSNRTQKCDDTRRYLVQRESSRWRQVEHDVTCRREIQGKKRKRRAFKSASQFPAQQRSSKKEQKKNSVIDRTIKTRRLLLLPQSGPIKNSLPRRKVERQKSASVYDLIIKTRTTRFSPFRWLIGVASWWGRIFPATPFPPKKKPQVEEEEEDGARLSLKIGSIRSSFFFFFFPFYIYTQSYIYI